MAMNIVALIPEGETSRITSREICAITNLSGAEVRKIVNESRANFIPIASDGNGYFIATEPDELNHTIAQLNSRIHKMIVAREGLKKAQRMMMEGK